MEAHGNLVELSSVMVLATEQGSHMTQWNVSFPGWGISPELCFIYSRQGWPH